MSFKKLALIDNGDFKFENLFLKKNNDPDLILVKPKYVGICSSDIPRAFEKKAYFYPLILGHEFSVEIIEDKRNYFKKGERCSVFPLLPCFKCENCKKNKFNMCKSYSYYGSRVNGGMQDQLYINRWNLIPLSPSFDIISASLIEPIAVCVHAVKKVNHNKKVLIYGGGFLAQIISQLLINKKCEVTCIDRNKYKKRFFNENIFFTTLEEDLKESSFDYVFEACGANNILGKCIKYGKPEAKIIQLANPSKDMNINANEISAFMRKEQLLIGTWNSEYRPDDHSKCDWRQTINLLENDSISVKNLISHKVELSKAIDLFNKIYSRRSNPEGILGFNKAILEITPEKK